MCTKKNFLTALVVTDDSLETGNMKRLIGGAVQAGCLVTEMFFFSDCSEKFGIVNNCRNHWQPAGGAVCIHNTSPPLGQSEQQQALQLTLQAVTMTAHPLFTVADNNVNHKTIYKFLSLRAENRPTVVLGVIPSTCVVATKRGSNINSLVYRCSLWWSWCQTLREVLCGERVVDREHQRGKYLKLRV